jgi:hypothetical protein
MGKSEKGAKSLGEKLQMCEFKLQNRGAGVSVFRHRGMA